ncbi:hypothetical protein [Rhodococcus sp. NPDC127528]|uniref:hypothetical protein n=1 Tax=unclassified Rhodococcus (in: high G+C Gram-positive bacteria) TaxID=192944 RepID=UPI0036379FD9
MIITPSHRLARYAVLPLAGLAAVGTTVASTGIANAGTLPATGPTVAMTITNSTNDPMILRGSANPYGQWINGPQAIIPPHSQSIVTAGGNDPGGIGVDVAYSLPGGDAVFLANNYGYNGGDLNGTRLEGQAAGSYRLDSHMDTGFPYLNAGYTVGPRPLFGSS